MTSEVCPACSGAGFLEVEGAYLGIKTVVTCGACVTAPACPCTNEEPCAFHHDRWAEEARGPESAGGMERMRRMR